MFAVFRHILYLKNVLSHGTFISLYYSYFSMCNVTNIFDRHYAYAITCLVYICHGPTLDIHLSVPIRHRHSWCSRYGYSRCTCHGHSMCSCHGQSSWSCHCLSRCSCHGYTRCSCLGHSWCSCYGHS